MAGFEGVRPGELSGVIREWRPGKYFPLYLAGIAAGVGLGIGIATWPGEDKAVPHVPAANVNTVDTASANLPTLPFELPSDTAVKAVEAELTLPGDVVPLPLEFQLAMGAIVLPVVAADGEPTVEPVAPAAVEPVAPAAAPPAAKPAAPSQPAAQPAQPPAAQPQAPAEPVAQAPAGRPNFYVPEVSSGPATGLESALFALINEERAKAGLAPYTLDAGLTKVARTRSQQMVDQGYFAHKDPYGYSMYVELLKHFGYGSYAWAGENLAMNNYSVAEAPGVALRGLMNSPTHKANLLAGDFYRIGIGEVTDANGRHYFTMIFLG